MSKVNYHGLTIKGLRKASGSAVNWAPRSGGYDEIFYDLSTGDVWTVAQVSLGCNSWTEYRDGNVIKICNTSRHMTMQEISDAIYEAVRSNAMCSAGCQAV